MTDHYNIVYVLYIYNNSLHIYDFIYNIIIECTQS